MKGNGVPLSSLHAKNTCNEGASRSSSTHADESVNRTISHASFPVTEIRQSQDRPNTSVIQHTSVMQVVTQKPATFSLPTPPYEPALKAILEKQDLTSSQLSYYWINSLHLLGVESKDLAKIFKLAYPTVRNKITDSHPDNIFSDFKVNNISIHNILNYNSELSWKPTLPDITMQNLRDFYTSKTERDKIEIDLRASKNQSIFEEEHNKNKSNNRIQREPQEKIILKKHIHNQPLNLIKKTYRPWKKDYITQKPSRSPAASQPASSLHSLLSFSSHVSTNLNIAEASFSQVPYAQIQNINIWKVFLLENNFNRNEISYIFDNETSFQEDLFASTTPIKRIDKNNELNIYNALNGGNKTLLKLPDEIKNKLLVILVRYEDKIDQTITSSWLPFLTQQRFPFKESAHILNLQRSTLSRNKRKYLKGNISIDLSIMDAIEETKAFKDSGLPSLPLPARNRLLNSYIKEIITSEEHFLKNKHYFISLIQDGAKKGKESIEILSDLKCSEMKLAHLNLTLEQYESIINKYIPAPSVLNAEEESTPSTQSKTPPTEATQSETRQSSNTTQDNPSQQEKPSGKRKAKQRKIDTNDK